VARRSEPGTVQAGRSGSRWNILPEPPVEGLLGLVEPDGVALRDRRNGIRLRARAG